MNKTILVIEDDESIRESIKEALEMFGYTVHLASDGVEGLDKLKNTIPCVILLDLMMPTMNGWQFRNVQQLDPVLANIPVVILSADSSVKQKAAKMGISNSLRKPIHLTDLMSVAQRYCERI